MDMFCQCKEDLSYIEDDMLLRGDVLAMQRLSQGFHRSRDVATWRCFVNAKKIEI